MQGWKADNNFEANTTQLPTPFIPVTVCRYFWSDLAKTARCPDTTVVETIGTCEGIDQLLSTRKNPTPTGMASQVRWCIEFHNKRYYLAPYANALHSSEILLPSKSPILTLNVRWIMRSPHPLERLNLKTQKRETYE